MKVCLYLSVLCDNLVLSAWCAYIQVLPTISLYALIKRYALKIIGSCMYSIWCFVLHIIFKIYYYYYYYLFFRCCASSRWRNLLKDIINHQHLEEQNQLIY